ncbi:hypothetical protein Tco_0406860, partial [Tanacetum coccineum]
ILVEGSRDQVRSQYSYFFSIEEDPRTYNEVMQSRDAAFWKEAIDDEIGSIMENNTWVLYDLPPIDPASSATYDVGFWLDPPPLDPAKSTTSPPVHHRTPIATSTKSG